MIKFAPGVEDFKRLRENQSCYVDKTGLIEKMLKTDFEALIITRPRRFGKTLTMSMLENFFDIAGNSKALFEGLKVSKKVSLCDTYQNQYPTLFLSLKKIDGADFKDAIDNTSNLLADACKKYRFLIDSDSVDNDDKTIFEKLKAGTADYKLLKNALSVLIRMLHDYYNKPVILLIDEYDVPLAKASEHGYYNEMVGFIRAFLGDSLKTNSDLKFAIITGCLKISKESIFTGANHFVVDDISNGKLGEYIGFTKEDVDMLVKDNHFENHLNEIKEWYDGYQFSEYEIYCPWSVISYLDTLQYSPMATPKAYWVNTSHNDIIYRFVSIHHLNSKNDLENLLEGKTIETEIEENLTYDYLKSNPKNFWSLLYLTGYLTKVKEDENGTFSLRIPNKEVKEVFQKSILEWFNSYVVTIDRHDIYRSLWNKDIKKAQTLISNLLFSTISYHDYAENYYHSFITGLFSGDQYNVESNKESGTGRPDVLVIDSQRRRIMIIEIKYAKEETAVPSKTKEGLLQFKEERYLESTDKGYLTRIGYVMTFHKKDCYITEYVPA